MGVEAASGDELGSLLCCFFGLLDFLGDSLALSLFSLLDSAFVDEGLDVSFAGLRVFAGAFGVEGEAVVGRTGLLSGVPKGLGNGLTVALTAAVAAGVAAGALGAVALVEEVTPVVVALVTPTLSSALKRGAGTP